jgi:CO dehydrogenase/acetyl-CoA synthase gamma subunit (corrinoid Fe-S protein)
LQDNIAIRRAPLLKQFKPFGFPTINLPSEMTDDPAKEALYASVSIAKYGGIVVLKDLDPTYVFPLLLQRLNIYTDPQRPMIVTPGIYPLITRMKILPLPSPRILPLLTLLSRVKSKAAKCLPGCSLKIPKVSQL